MSKIPNGHEIISLFESMYPKHLAMEGDKIGLQIGALNKPVRHVLIALDVTEEVVDEAIQLGANVIIAHHPLIFNPLKAIHTDKAYGKIIEKCIKNDIAIYAAHTNVDVAKGGVNDLLAEALGLQNTEVLAPTYAEEMKKSCCVCASHSCRRSKECIRRRRCLVISAIIATVRLVARVQAHLYLKRGQILISGKLDS